MFSLLLKIEERRSEMKKKYSKIIIPVVIILAIIGGGAGFLYYLSQDDVLNMDDVYATIFKVLPYFAPVMILFIAFIVALIVFRKKSKTFKFWLKWESILALLLAVVLTVNVVLFGPMANIFNLKYADLGTISSETLAANTDLTKDIAKEGTVLLKNEESFLPVNPKKTKLNVFGWASTNPVYGGTGSGNVDTSNSTDILDSLENAGFELNNDLSKFYKEYRDDRPEVGMWSQDWTLPEPAVSDYSDKLVAGAKDFSETALVVIGRVGGEGADLPLDLSEVTYEGNKGDFAKGDHFLQLSKSEKEMVELVTDNFDDVIVVINTANAMELGWLEEYKSIKSAIWMAGPGADGFEALGQIISGEVNPSGRTVDTFVYDLKATPTWNTFGDFAYKNTDGIHYVDYSEGIYVGYKFYETAYLGKEKEYQEVVQYPFGYGLSYTNFEQKMSKLSTDAEGNVSFKVTVKNTGKVAGKEVVEVYYTPPYENGGIEKAAVNLLSFAKTKKLKPGESEVIEMSFSQEDLAAYDSRDNQAYILEKGEYAIQLMADSHTVLASEKLSIPKTIVYGEDNKRASDEVVATNQFTELAEGGLEYLSRADNFANYDKVTAGRKDATLADEYKDKVITSDTYEPSVNKDDKMPTTGAKNGLTLSDLRGVDYDDEKWDKLLDQLTVKEMVNLIAYGGYQTVGIKSVGKLQTYDFDGPAGLSSFFLPTKATAFPTATMIAATWNKELAKKRGEAIGQEGSEIGISGWYGPAMNIHRSAFAGRNFEYYSEDGVLSGVMAENETLGAGTRGVYVYLKHFALNDQETNRNDRLLTWSNEQAIREIYLKPFEMAVKNGKATAIMSAFNHIGTEWAGGSSILLKNVLRSEWGFDGMVLTDYFSGKMSSDLAIRSGNDLMLSTTGEKGATLADTTSATAVTAMRQATHNALYTVVNSNAYKNKPTSIPLLTWQKTVLTYTAVVVGALLLLQLLVVYLYFKRIKEK